VSQRVWKFLVCNAITKDTSVLMTSVFCTSLRQTGCRDGNRCARPVSISSFTRHITRCNWFSATCSLWTRICLEIL